MKQVVIIGTFLKSFMSEMYDLSSAICDCIKCITLYNFSKRIRSDDVYKKTKAKQKIKTFPLQGFISFLLTINTKSNRKCIVGRSEQMSTHFTSLKAIPS